MSNIDCDPFQPIAKEGHHIHCQACGSRLATVYPDVYRLAFPNQPLFADGDSVPGTPLRIVGMASAVMASTGRCPACNVRHWSLEVMLHPAGDVALLDWLAEGGQLESAFRVQWPQDIAPWIVDIERTDNGPAVQHQVGPFPCDQDVLDRAGGFWPHARETFHRLLPTLLAVQGRLPAMS